MVFKIAHFVELNRSYQPAKFHWLRLSGSNFTRAGEKHLPPAPLTRSQKPGPYKVKPVAIMIVAKSKILDHFGSVDSIVELNPAWAEN